MHWTLPQVHALTPNQHAALVEWLRARQQDAEERSRSWA